MKHVIAWGVLWLGTQAQAWTLVAAGIGGWSPNPLTVHYDFSACAIPEAELIEILDRALDAWNRSQDASLILVRGATSTPTTASQFGGGTATATPVLLCDPAFSANQGVDGNVVPAATRLAASAGRIDYAGVVINAETGKAANIVNLTADQIEVTLAHELGHVLGLGHSSNQRALMFYSINAKTDAILSEDDMDGIAFLYPRSEFRSGPYGCAHAPRANRSVDLGWLMALLLAPLLLGRFWLARLRPEPLPESRERLP